MIAGREVQRAIRTGQLVRPRTCSACGGGRRIEAHHDDYSKPLEVRWLCPACHGKADAERRRLGHRRAPDLAPFEPEWFSPEQAAGYLGVSPPTIDPLPYYRLPGGAKRYRRRDLDAFVTGERGTA